MKELGISQAVFQFCSVSLSLEEMDSALMAKEMGISVSRISRVIDKMVNDGLLERSTCKHDRRQIKLALTAEGKSIAERIREHRQQCELKITENLSPEMIEQIRASLFHLIEKS